MAVTGLRDASGEGSSFRTKRSGKYKMICQMFALHGLLFITPTWVSIFISPACTSVDLDGVSLAGELHVLESFARFACKEREQGRQESESSERSGDRRVWWWWVALPALRGVEQGAPLGFRPRRPWKRTGRRRKRQLRLDPARPIHKHRQATRTACGDGQPKSPLTTCTVRGLQQKLLRARPRLRGSLNPGTTTTDNDAIRQHRICAARSLQRSICSEGNVQLTTGEPETARVPVRTTRAEPGAFPTSTPGPSPTLRDFGRRRRPEAGVSSSQRPRGELAEPACAGSAVLRTLPPKAASGS